MGLLKLVNDIPGIDYVEYRDTNYYGKYKYRARVTFPGIYLTTYARNITQFLDRLECARSGWRRLDKTEIKKNIAQIEEFLKFKAFIAANKKDYSIRIEGDTAGIFSNDLAKLLELKGIKGISVDYTESITSKFTGVKYFVREPKHKYRIYLRSAIADSNFLPELKETLERNKLLYPSKSLKSWLYRTRPSAWHYRYCSSAYSIDYDDESTLSYLALMHGNMLGNKYKLEKRPEPI